MVQQTFRWQVDYSLSHWKKNIRTKMTIITNKGLTFQVESILFHFKDTASAVKKQKRGRQ